jgi:hypothetical protein
MKKLVFYLVFFLMFLVGGFLNYFGVLSYKMIFGAALPLIILPFIKIKVNSFLYFTIIFVAVIVLSSIINQTNPLLTIWFFQNAAIPFLMYVIVVTYLSEKNITSVYKWIIRIATIQFPIILLQRFLYPLISKFAKIEVSDYDIGFGTFYTSDDIALSFFVLGVILYILFDNEHNYFVRHKVFLLIWLTLTILVLNSKISYLILGLIWSYYLITKVRVKVILYFLTVGLLVFMLAYILGLREQIELNVSAIREQLAFNMNPSRAEYFYDNAQGNRAAALLHLSTEPPKILGEGPHALYNPITNKFNMGGDTSQLISFYVELGFIGLFVSYLMLYSIIRGLHYSQFIRLNFIMLFFISVVSNIFLDASIMMIFVIFSCSHLIPSKEELVLK